MQANALQPTDHICVERDSYYHHGLVFSTSVNIIQILHWTGTDPASATARMTSLEDFLGTPPGEIRRVLHYASKDCAVIVKSFAEISALACEVYRNSNNFTLGQFNIGTHNCEHLVTFLRTGVWASAQVQVL